jgi:methyltransferase-like protein
MVDVTTVPLVASPCGTGMPQAQPLARADAASGMSWTTNQRHETVALSVVQRAIFPLMDGTHDVDALVAALNEKVRQGAIVYQRDGQPLTGDGDIEAASRDHIGRIVEALTTQALRAA